MALALIRQIASDIARAATVLAMVFLCFAAAPPDAAGADTVQQAGAAASLFQVLCGGHDQPQLACHAPNACCRPGQALLPARAALPEPAYGRVGDVVYADTATGAVALPLPLAFRSRAPPV